MHKRIPRFLLKNSVTLFKRSGVDTYGKVTYATGIDIDYVYIENIKGANNSNYGELQDCNLLLIYDVNNSTPAVTFDELDKVEYDNKDFIVRSVETFKDCHYEVYLK